MKPKHLLWSVAAFLAASLLVAAVILTVRSIRPDGRNEHLRTNTITVVDDVGRRVTLNYPVKRTVVLNRYVLEQVRAIGGMDVVVGVDAAPLKEPEYWPTLTPGMVVGQNQSNPNYEEILGRHPDVVMLPRNAPWQAAERALKPFGIPVLVITAWDIETHERNGELLGRIYDQAERARKFNAFYRKYRNLLDARLAGLPSRKRVYIEETRANVTAIEGSGWHAMIEAAGGRNVYLDVKLGDQKVGTNPHNFPVDPEETLSRNPEAIIKLQPGQYRPHPKAFAAGVLKTLATRPGLAETAAFREGRVYSLSYYMASGASKLTGALQIAKWLYPERFADVDPEGVMRIWLEEFQHVPGRDGYSHSLAEASGPAADAAAH